MARKHGIVCPTNLRIKGALKTRLNRLAKKFSVSPSYLLRTALRAKLDDWEKPGAIIVGNE